MQVVVEEDALLFSESRDKYKITELSSATFKPNPKEYE